MAVKSYWIFSGLLALLLVVTVMAAISSGDAGRYFAPIATILIVAAVTSASYFALRLVWPKSRRHLRPESGFDLLFVASMVASVLAIGLFIALAETSPFVELIKSLVDPNYVPSHSDMEIRLPTSMMPRWAEAAFELARRFAYPVGGVIVVLGLVPRTPLRVSLVVAVGLVLVLATLDRAVPVMYCVLFYGARFMAIRQNPLKDRWLYATAILGIVAIVGLKPIQYGHFTGFDVARNTEVSGAFLNQTEDAPSALPASPLAPPPVPLPAPSPTTGSGAGQLAAYAGLSVIERLVLSPVAMAVYAFDTYNQTNFQHWSSTRVLSIVGIGRYVDPLETPTATKHHDAFPVTFIGDLWRQGGYLYVPLYAVLLGLLMQWMDRTIFANGALVWRPFALVGLIYLFYGNAFNATSLVLIFGSLAGYYFTRFWGRQMGPEGQGNSA